MNMNMKIVIVLLSALSISAHAANGIEALIQVTQQKSEQSNDEALSGADKQRDQIRQQKVLRNTATPPVQRNLPGVKPPVASGLQRQLLNGLKPADDLQPKIAKLGGILRSMQQAHRKAPTSLNPMRKEKKNAQHVLRDLQNSCQQLIAGFAKAEKHTIPVGGQQTARQLKAYFDSMLRDLEAQDKLDNFDMQDLMSQYNQSQQLASSVKKKKDDTANSVINNVR